MFKKTSKKNIKSGDLFSFETKSGFGYGRVIQVTILGVACILYNTEVELFDPNVNTESFDYILPPILIDTYSVFVHRLEGNLGIIKKDSNFIFPKFLDIYRASIGGEINGEFQILNFLTGEVSNINFDPKTKFNITDSNIHSYWNVVDFFEANKLSN